MRMIKRILVLTALASAPAIATADAKKPVPAKTPPKTAGKTAPKPAPPKKQVVVSAEHKKSLAELYAGFKFGMSKDDVIAVLSKSLDAKFDPQINATTDVAQQDKLRKLKRDEVAVLKNSYIDFNGKKTGWDVSIVEEEFAHNTSESMVERWEKEGNLNNRRFFFFYEGKLWKMFVSLDVSILPAEAKTFDSFKARMETKYGPGDVEATKISWHTDEFDVHALDKLKAYDALGMVIEDNKVKKDLYALREQKAPPKHETASIIKSVVDTDNKDHPDTKANSNAVDAVINAQGGAPKKK